MKRLIGVIAAAVLVGLVAAFWHRHTPRSAALRVAVAGGDGGGLPIAQPQDEHFDAAALERISRDPAASGLAAFIVMRHGHVVFQRYGHGFNADSVIDSGPFARVLVALLAGAAFQERALPASELERFDPARLRAAIERGTHQRYADYLSHTLWSPLNAAAAWIELPAAGAPTPADCCFEARVQDWMRIGGLLVNDGSFEDTPVLRRGWVARMRLPLSADQRQGFGVLLPSRAPGSAGYDAADVFFLRGPNRWRLWMAPSLQLVVLFGASNTQAASAAAPGWDETRLPNLVIESLTDRAAAPAQKAQSLLRQLVPGH